MKKWLWIVLVFNLIACNDGKNTKGQPTELESIDRVAELQKLTPYSGDKMKSFLPGILDGMQLQNVESEKSVGVITASGDYLRKDSTTFSLTLFDCVGEAGVGFYQMQYESQLKMSSNTSMIVEINKSKAIINHDEGKAGIIWMLNERILAWAEGAETDLPALKKMAKDLKL